jgi:DNA polymerase III delta subunit
MAARKQREPDPPTQLRQLAARVEREGLTGGAVFRGDERYFSERGLELVARAAQAKGLELARHDKKDPEFELSRLLDDLGAAPMFSKGRCVIVRNADPLLAKSGKDDAPFVRAALAFLTRGGEGLLALSGGGAALRADSKLCRAIVEAGGALVSCRKLWDSAPPWKPDPTQAELVQWLLGRAREERVKLAPPQAVYLAAATGNDLAALDTQLEKLRHGGGESLQELAGWEDGGTPWKAADELVSGDLARALAALESLFRAGFHSDRDGKRERDPAALANILLGSLRPKLRQLLAGSRALAAGLPPDAAAAAAGVPGNPRAKASFQQLVGRRSPARWEAMVGQLAELDRKTRTGADVDASDFARLALSWKLPAEQPRARGARR